MQVGQVKDPEGVPQDQPRGALAMHSIGIKHESVVRGEFTEDNRDSAGTDQVSGKLRKERRESLIFAQG